MPVSPLSLCAREEGAGWLCVHREYISTAQARNILGLGRDIKHAQRKTRCALGGERERERERERISVAATTLGFLGSGKEAKKILSFSL
ncbi:hypothetical protein PAHAL_5G494800 [Panicum hallii]|jgi:hypothetical protein|uniref:Uncharacterized protein n=1 Tax=Panicum hallii TaxID=206008 RepID=A0A2T8IP51_9POAL|nr:hypothetical protein PAHAL_5G494800 [Panicum hallii]